MALGVHTSRIFLAMGGFIFAGATSVAGNGLQVAVPGQSSTLSLARVVTVRSLPPRSVEPFEAVTKPFRALDPSLDVQKSAESLDRGESGEVAALGRMDEAHLATVTSFIGLRLSDGVAASGVAVIPPDTFVAAGPTHIVETVNRMGRVLTKDGTTLLTFRLADLFGIPAGLRHVDPKVYFDHLSSRWFVVLVTDHGTFGTWWLAVSTTSDPLGSYFVYTASTAGSFPDFPGIGVTSDKVVLTANAFACSVSCDGSFVGVEVLVANKAHVLAGLTAATSYFPPTVPVMGTSFTIQPARSLSTEAIMYMVSTTQAGLFRLWSVTGVPGSGSGSLLAVVEAGNFAEFTHPPDAVQQGTSAPIETNDRRPLDAVFHGGSIWVVANSACVPNGDVVVRACIRLVNATPSLPGSGESLLHAVNQNSNFGIAGAYVYYPAIQVDTAGNLAIVFSRSSAAEFASVYVTGRLTTDPPNTLRAPVLLKAGEAPYDPLLSGFSRRRFGDYSGAALDPADGSLIWIAGQYARAEGGAEWGTWIGRVRIAPLEPPLPPHNPGTVVAFDFDGDGKADLGVFRRSTGQWFIFGSASGFPGPVLFGSPGLGDTAVAADYDGDGKTDLAIYRTVTAEWFIFGSATGFPGPVPLGSPGLGDVPVPADYDGDGKTDLAVYRTTTAQWFIFGSTTGFGGPVLFGAPGVGDLPIPADYDGDGKADLAVFRQSTGQWFIFRSSSGFGGPVLFGAPGLGDTPVPADYDGDGLTDLAVFRQSTGQWFIFRSSSGFGGPVLFGAPGLGDLAVPADFDGDGKADLAVFRQSTGQWFIFRSSSGFPGPVLFGAPGLGDTPVNHSAAVR